MPEITIDEEFKNLLPALDEKTYAMLEESLLENGCMHPLVLWDGILIDGHNRYEICQKHEIPFKTTEKEFASRDEALIWIITTQVARRNLNPIQLSYYRGLHYHADKRLVKNVAGNNQYEQIYEVKAQNGPKPQSGTTSIRLSDEYNVSKNTIKRDAQLANAIDAIGENSPEAKREILSGKSPITRQHLQNLAADGTDDEIKSIAESIEQGTYERPKKSTVEPPEGIFQGILDALNGVMAQIAQAYSADIRRAANENDAAQLRAALRGHIDKLEDLYRSL